MPVAGGEPVFADLSNYSPGDSLDRSRRLAAGQLARVRLRPEPHPDLARLLHLPAEGGPLTRLFRETTKAWVDDPGEPIFLADGSFLLASEGSGWKHLYHFDKDGKR